MTTELSAAPVGDDAVVVGASIAGLAAAASLSPRFRRVTVIERDTLPPLGEGRHGVPQGSHAHLLLPGGLRALDRLLPGVATDVQKAGGHIIPASEFRFYLGAGRLAVDNDTLAITGATRPLLEGVIRRRVAALENVTLADGEVDGLVTDPTGATVNGVSVAGSASTGPETVSAELVVDASGRRSRTPAWLDTLGYPQPEQERMQVGVHYSTRLFHREPDDLDGCRHVAVAPPPEVRRGGLALAVERDRWLVTLVGTVGERPPTDLDAFVDYAARLWQPDLGHLVKDASPIGDPTTGGFPAHLRRRYDRLRRIPERLVTTGDALCSLSPLYGQGMAVSILEAELLGDLLDRHGLDRIGRRFLRRSRRIVDTAWTLATSADLTDPAIEGPRTVGWRILNRYLDRAMRVATSDSVVADSLLAVNALVAPPPTMLRPRVVARVLRLRENRNQRSSPAPDRSGGAVVPS
ncbi:MAG: FAD-dependent oxidoreductase [Acidimicrobiales bacterium]